MDITYNCSEECYFPVNGDFEYVADPKMPGTMEASSFFNFDMCSWTQALSTPYYCYYPEDTYIAVRVDNSQFEKA